MKLNTLNPEEQALQRGKDRLRKQNQAHISHYKTPRYQDGG